VPDARQNRDVALTQFAEFVNSAERSDGELLRRVEALDVSADIKALLAELLRWTSKVGNELLRIGRKILEFVLTLAKQFPLLTFSVLIALVVGVLLAAVPVLGGLLGPVLTPLALALGVAWGAKQELATPDLADRVREFAANFSGVVA
jgi:hypothetical protein